MTRPLLLMSCSQVKRQADRPLPITELYDGPIWKQVRANYPASHVAVLSAEHGVLAPGSMIESYDRQMDADRLVELVNDTDQFAKLRALVDKFGVVVVMGGELYKLLALAMVAMHPDLIGRVRFNCGSYLKQRKALKSLLDLASA